MALAALPGCKSDVEAENRAEREANAKKVTADSTEDATLPIVDEDFGFRLALPGPGWKLLHEKDASSLSPDAVAGALEPQLGAYGIVIVERLPGTTLEQALALLWQKQPPGLLIESETDLEFHGVPAKRRVFTAEVEGHPFRYVTTVFLRQDHLYQMLSWSLVSRGLEPLMAFQDAVELLDGEVVGRNTSPEPITHADGVGWRIREGRYESALSGLRVRPPEGWRFVVGSALEQLGSDAEIVLLHEANSLFVALTVERVSKPRLEALAALSRRNFLDGEAPIGEPLTREVAGQAVEFRRYRSAPLEFLHGVYVGDDAITGLSVWYPQALSKDVADEIDGLLAGFAEVPASERAKLHEELLGVANSQQRFAANRAYRAGEFLDFENQLRWTKPPGFWHVDGFDKALDHSPETVLLASEAELGVHAALEVFDAHGNQAADTIAALIADNEILDQTTVEIDGLTIHRAHTVDPNQSPAMSYVFSITRRGDRMIALMAWSADDSAASRNAMDAAIAGLDYAPALERTTVSGRTFTDVRYGLSFDIPGSFSGAPQLTDIGVGQVAVWSKGEQALISMNVNGAKTDDEEWISSFFEQVLRDRIGAEHALGKPERSETKLGGHAGRRLTWDQNGEKLTADIVVRDSLIYCMLYANLSDGQISSTRNSWKLR